MQQASMKSITQQITKVREQIAEAELRFDRPAASVQLLAVSKTRPAEDIQAALACGQTAFGENYLQEALEKISALSGTPAEWHFIGPIQSNKTRDIAEHFQWVHSVDRLKIAQRLNDQRPTELPPLNICIQVNTSGENSKSGVAAEEVLPLAKAIAAMPRLVLRGLMTIPAPEDDFEQQRLPFARLRQLQENLREAGIVTDTLSMGMTDDLEAAIAEGATMVRIGTAIFGKRSYS